MADDLPVVHQSEYIDPLEADDGLEIAVMRSQGILLAVGNGSMDEWIRWE